MSDIYIKVNGAWEQVTYPTQNLPTEISGSWRNQYDTKEGDVYYLNNTGKLIYVSAVIQVRTVGTDTTGTIAGASAWGFVSSPNPTTEDYTNSEYTNVCRVRDNGTANATRLYLNPQFFVPPNCKYVIQIYNYTNITTPRTWPWGNRLSVLSWNEFVYDFKY